LNLRYLGRFDWGSLDARAYHETVKHFMDFGDDKRWWYSSGTAQRPACAAGMPMQTESKNTGGVVKASIKLTAQDLLRVGGEYQRYRLDDSWLASGSGMMMAPDTFLNINNGQRDRSALFAEWESRINPAWMTQLGARYERVNMDAGPVHGYSGLYAMDANAFNAQDREKTDNNWDMTALAQLHARTTQDGCEFGFSRKVRSPNLYERFAWSRTGMAMLMIMNFTAVTATAIWVTCTWKPEKAHTLRATFDWHAVDRALGSSRQAPYYHATSTDYIDARRCSAAAWA
jgi:iron complex outermembrane receptor protein